MKTVEPKPSFRRRCKTCFHQQHSMLWPGLSRTANLLGLLAGLSLLILMPLGFHDRLWNYLTGLAVGAVAAWLLGASILFWLHTGPPA